MTHSARELEAVVDRCWPSPHECTDDWIIRFGLSSQFRPASATYLSGSEDPAHLDDVIILVEQRFQRRDRATVVQIIDTDDFQPHVALADALLRTGRYVESTPSCVYAADLQAVLSARPPDRTHLVTVDGDTDLGALTAQGWSDFDSLQATLKLLSVKSIIATCYSDDSLVGLARGAITGRWLGCFNFFVVPEARQRGVATALMRRLVQWGLAEGATMGVLQVEEGNEQARVLYERLSFANVYSYHYLVGREESSS